MFKYILVLITFPFLCFVAVRNCFVNEVYKGMSFDVAFVYQLQKFLSSLKESS